jgi:hypothetical protein
MQIALKAKIPAIELGGVEIEAPLQAEAGEVIELAGRLDSAARMAKQGTASHRPMTGPAADDPVVLFERR